jgi:hypothetical protein
MESMPFQLTINIMNSQEKIIEFASFCIEEYKFRHHLTGDAVVQLFEKNKIIRLSDKQLRNTSHPKQTIHTRRNRPTDWR